MIKNISVLHNSIDEDVSPPTDKERKEYENAKEENEERHCSENVVEAKGLFEYNDADIDKYPYRLDRAIKYTEMICKALPSFNSSLKLIQKKRACSSHLSLSTENCFRYVASPGHEFRRDKERLARFRQEGKYQKRE